MISALGLAWTAVVLSLPLTLLFVAIDLGHHFRGRAGLRACWSLRSWFFFLLLAASNSAATLLVWYWADGGEWPIGLGDWARASLYAFIGVVGYEIILSNLSISLGQQISIQPWVGKARDSAVAKAARTQARINKTRDEQIRRALYETLSEQEMNSEITHFLGAEAIPKLEDEASEGEFDSAWHKAGELATKKPSEMEGLLKERKKNE